MNKNDLIQKLAGHDRPGQERRGQAVDGVFNLIEAALKDGDEVRLTGFGVFVVAQRAGGKGRNPQTGEEITIKPSKQPRFRPGKQLKGRAELRSARAAVDATAANARRGRPSLLNIRRVLSASAGFCARAPSIPARPVSSPVFSSARHTTASIGCPSSITGCRRS